MAGDLDLPGLARALHRSYDWTQRHWRRLVREEALPAPFIGGEPGGRPWWNGQAVAAWKAGRGGGGVASQGVRRHAQPSPAANDALAAPPAERAARLLASLG